VRQLLVTDTVVLSSPILVTLRCEEKPIIFRSVRWFLVTASVVLSSPILITLMKEELSSSETSLPT
jgi:hypothetical protein